MKKLFTLSMLTFAISTLYADWRMERFDVNVDDLSPEELEFNGCTVRMGLFKYDKNDDGKLSKKELRKASEYIIRHRCPKCASVRFQLCDILNNFPYN